MKEFVLPELGENIEEAAVIGVMVSEGDTVKKDQPVLEIETDKATVEVPSEVEGKIEKLYIKEGDKVKTGQVVFEVSGESDDDDDDDAAEEQEKEVENNEDDEQDEADEQDEKKMEKEDPEKEEKAKASTDDDKNGEGGIVEFTLPELGENIESAKVVGVLVEKGDTIKKDQSILEIETDKATIEVPSDVEGSIVDFFLKEGDTAKVGQTVMKVETGGKTQAKKKKTEKSQSEKKKEKTEKKPEKQAEPKETEEDSKRKAATINQPPILEHPAPAAPSVRRIARELGVDINNVEGKGPGGRISMDDVKAYVKNMNEGRSGSGGGIPGLQTEDLPDFSKFGDIERKAMSTIREKTAKHLSYAWATIPHVTQHDKADVTELEKIRKDFSEKVSKKGGKLTITSILVKIIASAMKVFPQFNSSVDMQNNEIIYKKYINIGVAVDTERGLIVPVIKDADKKNITDISIELTEISQKARDKKISLETLRGGCFSISNLGGIGGTYFTPVVNSPEVAILGVSRGVMEPVYIDGEFQPRLLVPLSLSYDHRVIDGADAMRFLKWVREALEQPFNILVDG